MKKIKIPVHWYRLSNLFLTVIYVHLGNSQMNLWVERGLFNKKHTPFSLNNLVDYTIDRSFIQRLLGCCTISFKVVNEEVDEITLTDIYYINNFIDLLEMAKSENVKRHKVLTHIRETI